MNLNDIYHQLIGKGTDPEVYQRYLRTSQATIRRGWALAILAIAAPALVLLAVSFNYLSGDQWYTSPYLAIVWTLVLWGISVSYAIKAMAASRGVFNSLGLSMSSPMVGTTVSEYTDGRLDDSANVQAFLTGERHGRKIKVGLGHQDSWIIYETKLPEFHASYENGQWQMSAHLPSAVRQALHQASPDGQWQQLVSLQANSKALIIHRRAKMTNLPWLFDLWLAEKILQSL